MAPPRRARHPHRSARDRGVGIGCAFRHGGVLVFDIQGLNAPFPQGFALESKYGGMRQVFLSLRPIEGAKPSCEMTLRSPLSWSQNTQDLAAGGILTGIGGGVGGALGVAAVTVLSAALGFGAVAAVLGALGGAAAGGGLAAKAYRAIYRYTKRRGGRALDGLLGAVAGRAEGGWGITALGDGESPPQLPSVSSPTDYAGG